MVPLSFLPPYLGLSRRVGLSFSVSEDMLDEVEECRGGGVEAVGSVDIGMVSGVEKFESMVDVKTEGLQRRELRRMAICLGGLVWQKKLVVVLAYRVSVRVKSSAR